MKSMSSREHMAETNIQISPRTRTTISWILSFTVGFSAWLGLFLWLPKNTPGQWISTTSILVITTAITAYVGQRFVFQFVQRSLDTYPLQWKIFWASACLLAGIWLAFNIPLPSPPAHLNPYAPTLFIKALFKLTSGTAIGFILFILTIGLAVSFVPGRVETKQSIRVVSALKYAIPTAIIWFFYLLAFYPGMMSADSMVQWGQILTGNYVDHHPAFHTFLLWFVTRIYLSPVSVAVSQIIALALVAGAWLAFFESLGINRIILWIAVLVFSAIPVNGTMVNTLWKDIPYSTAVLGLTLIIARVVFSKGEWIVSYISAAILGVTAALVLLLRHDGLPLSFGALLLLLLFYLRKWKSWLVSFTICGVLYFGIRGPVYKWVGVQKSSVLAESSLSLWSMAAYTNPGSDTEGVLSSIGIFSPDWDCNIWYRLDPDWQQRDLDKSISPLLLTVNLLKRTPKIILYYYRCARSMEWIVWDPYGEVRNASHVEVLVDPNPYGIQPNSKIPTLRDWIVKWVMKTSHDPNLNWFLWRPAIFLYLNLIVTAVVSLRNRDLRYILLSVPVLIQSVSFSLIFAEPNFRYHYAVYLVSLISVPLLFSPPAPESVLSSEHPESDASAGAYLPT